MSTFTIPNSQKQIRQVNSGDVFGELHETFNIDLTSSQGKIKVSKKLAATLLEGVNIGTPNGVCDFIIWDGDYYAFTEDEVYTCSVQEDPTNPANWSEESEIGDLDINSSVAPFGGNLLISDNTDIARWTGSVYTGDWWTSTVSGPALTTGYPHVLETLRTAQETVFVTDKNIIRYYNVTSGHDSFTLQADLVASCLASSLSGSMWAGTYNETSGDAMVYELQQGETIATSAYPVNATAVLAIWTKNNIPYIVTERGEVQQFNGAGFSTIAEFPFKYTGRALDGIRSGLIQDSNRSRPIHPRGVRVHRDSVYINVNTLEAVARSGFASTNYPVDTRSHSGIWEFNHRTEVLNHRFSFAHEDEDYGDLVQEFAYPILIVDNDYTFLIAGGDNDTNSTTNIYLTNDDTPQGWFVTSEITSQTVADAYEAVYHKARTLGAGEEIVTQYRTTKRDTHYGEVSWADTTTFATTDDWSPVEVGDLVRVVKGKSAGNYANITEISSSSSTYTITVDKEIGEAGTSSFLYCDNFKKDPNAYTTADGEYKKIGGYGTSPWIQFAVFLKGDVEYRQFIAKGNSKVEM